MSAIEPGRVGSDPPATAMPLTAAISTASPAAVSAALAASAAAHAAAAQRRDRRVQSRDRQELERRQHAAVDLPGLDVLAPARGEVDPGVAQHLLLELLLGLQQHLPDRRRVAEERVLALGPEDRGVFELHPAVEDRLRVDQRRAHAGRADLEEHVRFTVFACRAGAGSCPVDPWTLVPGPTCPRTVPASTCTPTLSGCR